MRRFLMSLGDESFKFTCSEAKNRGISVQQLIRAVIIPEWMEKSRSLDLKPLLSSRELSISLGQVSPFVIGERNQK